MDTTIICPYCLHEMDNCDCPDLFYQDSNNTKELNKQYDLLKEIQQIGYNIVTCGHCGNVFIIKKG